MMHEPNIFLPQEADDSLKQLSAQLGTNVRRLRIEQSLTKKTFALMVGIGRPLLDKIERGEADLRLSYIVKIAEGLSVRPLDLLMPLED